MCVFNEAEVLLIIIITIKSKIINHNFNSISTDLICFFIRHVQSVGYRDDNILKPIEFRQSAPYYLRLF